uniref:NADH dehydrogenase subunit 4L n=1 Tax=Dardanus hessii TaxID=2590950 RepID=UPI002E7A51D5|nr:NADH dehydrogenase subunit 4L [Dardanus hessii]WPN85846.1 NADH dehydrogenase subunit 4L [Dardanus hessii]
MTIFNNMLLYISFFMILTGLWSFVSYRKHLLNSLLSLEFTMLSIFMLMMNFISSVGCETYFALFFLTLAACEGALGLALLVSIVRSHGNDYFNTFTTMEC